MQSAFAVIMSVSIHHMLLFITQSVFAVTTLLLCFNTSHVTLYPEREDTALCHKESFNTSHVTLYLVPLLEGTATHTCFNTSHVTLYHSKKPKFPFSVNGFNTSHVTLYLALPGIICTVFTFQYITCYSLSLVL